MTTWCRSEMQEIRQGVCEQTLYRYGDFTICDA